MQLPPIAATTVGSFPRPEWLGARDRNDIVFHLEGDALREAQDDATALILGEQGAVGLDLVTEVRSYRSGRLFYALTRAPNAGVADSTHFATTAVKSGSCDSRTKSPRVGQLAPSSMRSGLK